MKNAQAGKADFTQSVTSPPKSGQEARTKVSSGSFEFQRPGKFRFNYTKPFEQLIVADGKTLWLYDADLNQVTERAQAQVLGSRAVSPSLRGTGGTELILRIEGLAQPQQSIISDPQAATWRPGQRLQLQWARGRTHGLYVTGWQLPND